MNNLASSGDAVSQREKASAVPENAPVVTGDAGTSEERDRNELERRAILAEFCHRQRKRELDSFKRLLNNWRFLLWRNWLKRRLYGAARSEEQHIRSSGLLNQDWYRRHYPEVRKNHSRHYVTTGALDGVDPNPLFDTDWYLARYSYPRKQGINPFSHYLTKGWRQGNSPHPLFDVSWYLERYPDVAEQGVEPLGHYLREGWLAGHQPSPFFDGQWYLEQYPEVREAGLEPLTHYVTEGVLKGFLPFPNNGDNVASPHHNTYARPSELLASVRRQHRGFLEKSLKRFLDTRNYQRCIEEFEAFSEGTTPDSNEFSFGSRRSYVRALAREGRGEEAIAIADSLVRMSPRDQSRWSLLGYLLAGNNPGRAREALRTALDLGSKSIMDAVLIIYSYQVEGRDPISALPDFQILGDRDNIILKGTARDDYRLAMAAIYSGSDKEKSLDWLNKYFGYYGLSSCIANDPADWGLDNISFAKLSAREDGPLVTVLMTSYNAEEHIEAAIRSVLNQSYRNIEVILVDDCSTDSTIEIARNIEQKDRRFKTLINKENVGTYASKNIALYISQGNYITCHDSDDVSHPEKIAKQVRVLEQKPKALACISKWCRMDDGGLLVAKRWGRFVHENPSSLMYRRSVVESIGFYDCVRTSADTEFQERIRARFGPKAIIKMPECMAFGRVRLNSLTAGTEFGFDSYGGSPMRQSYWRNWVDWHKKGVEHGERLYIPFPPNTDRPFEAPEDMQAAREKIVENASKFSI